MIFGSVGIEYAALGIPVINATVNNPHINYGFNINPSSLKNYKKVLNNQQFIKGNETNTYTCICKLVPSIDPDKVKVY